MFNKTLLICDMRELPKASSTILIWKLIRRTGVMSLPNSKNDEDTWTIRRRNLIPLCKGKVIVPTTTSKVLDEFSKLR